MTNLATWQPQQCCNKLAMSFYLTKNREKNKLFFLKDHKKMYKIFTYKTVNKREIPESKNTFSVQQ